VLDKDKFDVLPTRKNERKLMKKTYLIAAPMLAAALLAGGQAFSEDAAPAATKKEAASITGEMNMKMKRQMNPVVKKLHEAMRKADEENKETLKEVEAKRKELREIVRAATFDKKAFMAKHEEIKALMEKVSDHRMEAKADFYAGLTAEERSSLPDRPNWGMRGMSKGMMKDGMHRQGGPMMEGGPMMDRDAE
jgi:uncharacterized membrane protein